MFIAVLFTITKLWKQSKCLSMAKWIKKMWYIHAVEYNSSLKKKESLPFATIWYAMDLEDIMLNEISQTQKGKYCMISLICRI